VKRYIIYAIFIVFFILFQSMNLYTYISIRGVSPDFLLIGVVSVAFFVGALPGEIIGFATGFIVDIISGGLLGLSAFFYTAAGFSVGLIGEKVYGNYLLVSIITLFAATFLKAIILSMLAAIFIKPGFFGFFAQGRIFLEAVLNSVIAPLFFLFVAKTEKKFIG